MNTTQRSLSASLSALALLAAFGTAAHAAAATPQQHWIPAGEGIAEENVAPSTASDTTRSAVNAQTRQARRNGELQAAGEASGEREQRIETGPHSVLARSEVKAETVAAVRNGTIAPFGEAATYGGQ